MAPVLPSEKEIDIIVTLSIPFYVKFGDFYTSLTGGRLWEELIFKYIGLGKE